MSFVRKAAPLPGVLQEGGGGEPGSLFQEIGVGRSAVGGLQDFAAQFDGVQDIRAGKAIF